MVGCTKLDVAPNMDAFETVRESEKDPGNDCQLRRLANDRCSWTFDGRTLGAVSHKLDSPVLVVVGRARGNVSADVDPLEPVRESEKDPVLDCQIRCLAIGRRSRTPGGCALGTDSDELDSHVLDMETNVDDLCRAGVGCLVSRTYSPLRSVVVSVLEARKDQVSSG